MSGFHATRARSNLGDPGCAAPRPGRQRAPAVPLPIDVIMHSARLIETLAVALLLVACIGTSAPQPRPPSAPIAPAREHSRAVNSRHDSPGHEQVKRARVIASYRAAIISWFNRGWDAKQFEGRTCDEVGALSVSAQVGLRGRKVVGFELLTRSGHQQFDESVQTALASALGQQLPPPPSGYEDILEETLSLRYSGSQFPCKSSRG